MEAGKTVVLRTKFTVEVQLRRFHRGSMLSVGLEAVLEIFSYFPTFLPTFLPLLFLVCLNLC